MFLSKKLIDCWRDGQLVPMVKAFWLMGLLILSLFPIWLFGAFLDLTPDRLVLIDVLLGLPLLIALWLTMAIIWQGVVKTIACSMGGVRFVISPSLSTETNVIDEENLVRQERSDHARG